LDNLTHSYRIGKRGHRREKEQAKHGWEYASDAQATLRELFTGDLEKK
jgi:hypothetical protein